MVVNLGGCLLRGRGGEKGESRRLVTQATELPYLGVPFAYVGLLQLMYFLGVVLLLGFGNLTNDFVTESLVSMLVSVEGTVSLLQQVLDFLCHPGKISWVSLDRFGGKEVMVSLRDGGEVIIPLLRGVVDCQDLNPWVPHQPLPKASYR